MIVAARDVVGTCAVTRRYRRVCVEPHVGMADVWGSSRVVARVVGHLLTHPLSRNRKIEVATA
jgi:hypothetical protein